MSRSARLKKSQSIQVSSWFESGDLVLLRLKVKNKNPERRREKRLHCKRFPVKNRVEATVRKATVFTKNCFALRAREERDSNYWRIIWVTWTNRETARETLSKTLSETLSETLTVREWSGARRRRTSSRAVWTCSIGRIRVPFWWRYSEIWESQTVSCMQLNEAKCIWLHLDALKNEFGWLAASKLQENRKFLEELAGQALSCVWLRFPMNCNRW